MISDRAMVHALNSTAGRRIAAVAAPGSLLKRPAQPRGAQEAAGRDVDLDYLRLVRECPCLKCGMEPSEVAHIRFASAAFGKASGLGRKPDDRYSVPLCAGCHRLDRDAQHTRNEREFWDSIGINPLMVAQRLYAVRCDLLAMRAVIFTTIAERIMVSASPPSRSVPNTEASPASPPRRAPPPRPLIKPEGGEDRPCSEGKS
jgi:hypothetical protein